MLQRVSNSERAAKRSPAWKRNNARALGFDRSRALRARLSGPARRARARSPRAHVTVGAATAGAGGGSGRLRSAAQAPQGRAEPSPSCSL